MLKQLEATSDKLETSILLAPRHLTFILRRAKLMCYGIFKHCVLCGGRMTIVYGRITTKGRKYVIMEVNVNILLTSNGKLSGM